PVIPLSPANRVVSSTACRTLVSLRGQDSQLYRSIFRRVGSGAWVESHGSRLISSSSICLSRQARETSAVRLTMNGPGELTIYTVELHFNQLADDSDRRFFNSV